MFDKIKDKFLGKNGVPGLGNLKNISGNTASQINKILSNLKDDEIQKLVEEKLDYLKWLIKYSKANNLKLVPSPEGLNTFACGLDRSNYEIFEQYRNGEIKFNEIPEDMLKPSLFYYNLEMLLKSDTKSLGALSDHEIGHAEWTDFFDILYIAKFAEESQLPASVITLFFNGAIEDPFIGKKVSKKGPAKKNGVEYLYKNMLYKKTDGEQDLRILVPKINQLQVKIAYHWLNQDFPNTYNMNVRIDKDVEKIFNEQILPNFDKMISPDIPNIQRTLLKNSILFPILQDLGKKDLENAMKEEEMRKMMRNCKGPSNPNSQGKGEGEPQEGQGNGQPSQEIPKEGGKESKKSDKSGADQSKGNENKDGKKEGDNKQDKNSGSGKNDETGDKTGDKKGEKEENGSQKGGAGKGEKNESPDKEDGDKTKNNNNSGENSPEPKDDKSGEKDGEKKENKEQDGEGKKDKTPTEEEIDKMMKDLKNDPEKFEDASKKAQEEIDKMTEEEKKELEKKVKKQIDKENIDKLNQDLPSMTWSENKNGELEFKPKTSDKESKKEAEKFEKKLEDAIKQQEEDISKTTEIQKKINDITDGNELKKIKKEMEDIKSEKLKDTIEKQVQSKKEQIENERKRKIQNMVEQGFNLGEENDYNDFITLESKIEPYVDDFITALTQYIPKLKEYIHTGSYYTGVVYDIPKAARKIRMGHLDLYGRKDEIENMKINLGISISIDVSQSMTENNKMPESLKLMIFLGIFCEKLKIPFYVNTIGNSPREIKPVQDEYHNSKGNIMKITKNPNENTYMQGTFEKVQEVIGEQKFHNPEVEFIPIIITDGSPSDGSDELKKTIDKFDGLDVIFGLCLSSSDKSELKKYFKNGKKILLDDATEILDKGKIQLIDYLVDNKDRIFRSVTS